MPANPQQLHNAIVQIGSGLAALTEATRASQAAALRLLRELAAAPDRLIRAVNQAAEADPNLRCALPHQEDFSVGYPCPPGAGAPALLAVDGSQILTDRHEEVTFALINIGSVIIESGSGRAPEILVDTRVLFGDDLYAADGRLLSDGDIALLRDAAERQGLLANATAVPGLVALGDGPLELWGAKDASDPKAFERALRGYLEDLRVMQRRGSTVAGYVDKPTADLVVRMLEVSRRDTAAAGKAQSIRPLRKASDRWLFGRLLAPTQRSAIFALQSSSRVRYADDLAIHFFYLNVGNDTQPAVARVEIPEWVARDHRRIDALHQVLLDQCALLGARPYPYILHRAHETARVSMQEQEQIKLRLLLEMREHGLEPETVSGKSSAKSVSGSKGRF
ncbi:MAG: DNA double-strand break repair nuclease NurA [Chloroflexota bacterium]